MTQHGQHKHILIAACALAVASLGGSLLAAPANAPANDQRSAVGKTTENAARGDMTDAERQINDAAQVVRRMDDDPGAARLLDQAQGVFVVTHYGRAALGIGGQGGEGVLMIHRNGQWQHAAFYTIGGGSVGAEAGVEAGSLVYVLNTDAAVAAFDRGDNWPFNAEAGLTVMVWSGEARAPAGKGDVTVWADTKGVFGSVALSVTDIRFDADKTSAFYGKPMKVAEVFNGNAKPAGDTAPLQGALFAARINGADSRSAANIMRNATASASPDPNALPGH